MRRPFSQGVLKTLLDKAQPSAVYVVACTKHLMGKWWVSITDSKCLDFLDFQTLTWHVVSYPGALLVWQIPTPGDISGKGWLAQHSKPQWAFLTKTGFFWNLASSLSPPPRKARNSKIHCQGPECANTLTQYLETQHSSTAASDVCRAATFLAPAANDERTCRCLASTMVQQSLLTQGQRLFVWERYCCSLWWSDRAICWWNCGAFMKIKIFQNTTHLCTTTTTPASGRPKAIDEVLVQTDSASTDRLHVGPAAHFHCNNKLFQGPIL